MPLSYYLQNNLYRWGIKKLPEISEKPQFILFRKLFNNESAPLKISVFRGALNLFCKYRLNSFYPFVDFFVHFSIALVQAQTEHSAASFHAGELKFISAGAYITDKAGAAEAELIIEVRSSGAEAVGMAFLASDADNRDIFPGKINGVQQFYFTAPIFH